jgi:hypothetical protein
MEGFKGLHNNMVPKKHDSQNNTPLNITPLTHVSDGFYIECPLRVSSEGGLHGVERVHVPLVIAASLVGITNCPKCMSCFLDACFLRCLHRQAIGCIVGSGSLVVTL